MPTEQEHNRRAHDNCLKPSDVLVEYVKDFEKVAEKIAETTAKLVAHDVVKNAVPQIEASIDAAFKEMREKLTIQITGEDWENRAEVRVAIQWAIRQRRKVRIIEKGVFMLIGSGVGALIVRALMMPVPGGK